MCDFPPRQTGGTTRGQHPPVLVIGGAGYLGSLVVRNLLDNGRTVRLLDKFIYGDDSVRSLYSSDHLCAVEGDLRQVQDVVAAMHGVDSVIHLGAIVGDPACGLDERQAIITNLAATRMIAEVALGSGVKRFVFASTCSVYGIGDDWLDETSETNPVSLYGKTKLASEEILLRLGSSCFCPTILRVATLYGISPRPRFDLVINLLAAMARCEGRITVFGGKQWRPFLHVADAAAGFVRVLNSPLDRVCGQVFNLGTTKQNYQIREVARLISGVIPGVTIDLQAELGGQRNYRVCFEKIKRDLGFETTHSVEDGVREIVRALEEGIIADYRLDRYSNYGFLSDETRRARIQLNDSIFSYDIANRDVASLLCQG